MFGRELLRFSIRKGFIHPNWLKVGVHADLVSSLIQFFDLQLGKRRVEIDESLPKYIIGDEKLANGIVKVLYKYFYVFARDNNVRSNFSSITELRVEFYRRMGLRGWFATRRDRSRLLSEMLREMGLNMSLSEFEDVFWSKEGGMDVLTRKIEATTDRVIGAYNIELLGGFLRMLISAIATLKLPDFHTISTIVPSSFTRQTSGNKVVLSLLKGGLERAKPPLKELKQILLLVYALATKSKFNWSILFTIRLSRRDLDLLLTRSTAPYLWMPLNVSTQDSYVTS